MENVDAAVCYEWQKDDTLRLLEAEDEEQYGIYKFGKYILIVKHEKD